MIRYAMRALLLGAACSGMFYGMSPLSTHAAGGTPTRGAAMPTSVPATPLPTPAPVSTAAPPTFKHAHVTVTSLRIYDGNQTTDALYAGQKARVTFAYHVFGPPQTSHAIVKAVATDGTPVFMTHQTLTRNQGTVTVILPPSLTAGAKQVEAEVVAGFDVGKVTHTVSVLDPTWFQLVPAVTKVVGIVSPRVARVESNTQAARDPYIVRQPATFAREGRQTGAYQVVKLVWPNTDRSQVAVQASLVSMYPSKHAASIAYWNRVQQHQSCAQGCALHPHAAGLFVPVGHAGAAFALHAAYGVRVHNAIFVRGHIMVELWTYYSGMLSPRIAKGINQAALLTLTRFDKLAQLQQG